MDSKIKILIVEDIPADAEILRHEITKSGIEFDYKLLDTEKGFVDALKSYSPDIILSDYSLPGFDGMQALNIRNEISPFTPFILATGYTNEEIAVECMKMGADDYILKDNLTRLGQAIKSALVKKNIIEARYSAEEKLKESETKFRHIFENSPIGKSITGVDGSIVVNKALKGMLGYGNDDFIYKDWKSITYPDDIPRSLEVMEDLLNEKIDSARIEKRFLHKDGSIVWVELMSALQRDADGNPKYFISSVNNITERKKYEKALIESETRYRSFISQVSEGVYRFELDKPMPLDLQVEEQIDFLYDHAFIEECNSAFMNMYGIEKKEDIVGKSQLELHKGRDNPLNRETLREFIKSGYKIESNITEETNAGGQVKFFSNNALGIIENDFLVRIWGTQTDITNQVSAEKALKKSELEYRNLFESANDAIIIFEPVSEIILEVNKKACDIYGYTKEEFTKISLKQMSVNVERGEKYILETIKDGSKKDYDTRHYTKQGKVLNILSNASVIEYHGQTAILSINRDITEKKKAEERLQQSEERFQLASLATNDVIYDWDLLKNTGWFSESFKRLFGYDNSMVLFDDWEKMIHPDDVVKAMAYTDSIIKGGGNSWRLEYRLKRKNKTYAYVMDSGYIVRNENGEPVRFIGSLMDFSERKISEEALRYSESRFRKIFEESPFAIALVNIDFGFEKVNPEFCKMMGYSEEDLKTLTFKEITHPEYLEHDLFNISLLLKDEIPIYLTEKKYLTKENKIRWGEVRVSVIRNNTGNFQYFLVMIEDITDKKRAEESVRESEEHFRNIVKGAEAAYFRINTSGIYEEVNDSWLRIHKYESRRDIIGKHFSINVEKIYSERAEEIVKELLKGKPIETGEFSRLCKDGSIGYETFSLNPVIKNGKIAAIEGFLIDITEQKNALEELNESRERYRILIENMKEGVVYVDNNDVIQFMNKSGSNIYGYEPEEVIGKVGYAVMIHPGDINIILEKNKSRIEGKSDSYEIRGLKKNREIVWLRISGSPVKNKSGQVVGSVGILTDITERKLTEEALKKSEEQYRELVTQMTDGVYQSTPEGKFISINNAMVKMFGYDSQEDMMKIDIQHDLYYNIDDRYQPYPTDGEEHLLNLRLKKKDGTPIWVEESGWYIKDIDGNIIRHEGILRDITQRKLAEDTIKTLSSALEQSSTSIIITDLDGYMEYVNPRVVNTTGYSYEELIGTHSRTLSSDEFISEHMDSLMQKLYAGLEWKGEVPNKRKNGELFWESVSISPIRNTEGKITNYIIVAEDITEKKEKEKELIKAKEKAEESEKLKSHFLANMSHELRTPMVGILGFSEILMNDIKDESQNDMMSKIHRSGQRLMSTLNLILDLSRIEAGKLDMDSKEFYISESIKETIDLFEKTAMQKNLFIKFENNIKDLLIVQDERIIRDVLNNLINNAVKYTNKGGIYITADAVKEADIKYCVISVKDTGIGIPEDKLGIIFEEFRQVSEGISRKFEGTGLGLSITKKFVEKMNGIITVESVKGKGSVFTVKIPVLNSIASKIIKPEKVVLTGETESTTKKLSVLVVDDDESTTLLCDMYLKNNFIVETSSTADEAMELISKKKYDLILMDINLGKGKNGIELTADIKKLKGYEKIPIIALTAYAMKGDREEFIKAGCADYISKPFRKEVFIKVINRAIA
ncbi:MAG: PAS domain S-box protein [Ignavibacteria bacterium]|nr:PAS domain S-box protein [Ignavibacteria bacterium]